MKLLLSSSSSSSLNSPHVPYIFLLLLLLLLLVVTTTVHATTLEYTVLTTTCETFASLPPSTNHFVKQVLLLLIGGTRHITMSRPAVQIATESKHRLELLHFHILFASAVLSLAACDRKPLYA